MNTYADVLRYRELFSNLFRRDLQAKYRGSALGVAWTVANPLLLMGVYLLVFGVVWNSPFANGGHYPLFLLSGLAVWTFVAAALQSSTRSMLDNANLIRKTRFPRQLVPLSVVGAHVVAFGAMLALVLVLNFIVLSRVRATEWLAIPLAVLAVAFVAGISLTAASLNAIFRDVEFIVSALLVPWFFLTPVIYPLSQLAAAPARRLGDPLAEPAVADHRVDPRAALPRHPAAARGRDLRGARLAPVACVGAWVFSRVDDQIAIEV